MDLGLTYDQRTVKSKNLLARFAHRKRESFSVSLLELDKKAQGTRLLDFGCGDGNFLSVVAKNWQPQQLVGFEPYQKPKETASQLDVKTTWEEIKDLSDSNGLFDVVTCFEVFEHLSRERQIVAIKKILSVLKSDGQFIVSVPIEKGLPVLPKNLRRRMMSYKGNEHIYTINNVVSSLFGLRTSSLEKLRTGDEYLSHMGFYFDDIESVFSEFFEVKTSMYSPFVSLPYFLNSQIFYELTPLNNAS